MLKKHSDLEEKIVGNLPCLQSKLLSEYSEISHLFTTRAGGVSEGEYSSLNLSFARNDNPEHVAENFRRVAVALGCQASDIVSTVQTHTDNIRIVTAEDKGKGVTKPVDYEDIDALITNEAGIALSVYTADCIPVLFYDPVKGVIATAHCGWRGTASLLQQKVIAVMQEKYGCKTENILAVLGPGICQKCYEVSEDVAKVFYRISEKTKNFLKPIQDSKLYDETGNCEIVIPGCQEGKYQVDLWLANLLLLCEVGVLPEHIGVSYACTNENFDRLFSHRATAGKRGNLGGFIMLKEKE